MNLTAQSPAGRLLFSSDATYASVSRLAKAGRALKLDLACTSSMQPSRQPPW